MPPRTLTGAEIRTPPAVVEIPPRGVPSCPSRCRAITLVEILVTIIIAALIIGTATPAYIYLINEKKTDVAMEELNGFQRSIDRFYRKQNRYPASLEEIQTGVSMDPWGNPYRYLNLKTPGGTVNPRTNKDLAPLNTDYDLYSEGPDNVSLSPIGASESRDDIIRARNGKYIGRAAELR